MGRRVLIDELMKTTFRYYLFASFMAKTSLTSGQRRGSPFHGTRYRNICLPGRTKSDDLNLFLVQRSTFKNWGWCTNLLNLNVFIPY